jgi:hypothetical protein
MSGRATTEEIMETEFVPATPERVRDEVERARAQQRERRFERQYLQATLNDAKQLHDELASANRRIAELEAQLAARPVAVVPEPTGISFVGSKKNLAQRTHDVLQGIEWARWHLHSVPPERVLGEGEERIDSATLCAYRSALLLAQFAEAHPIDASWRLSLAGVVQHFDALRASKGGENAQ